MIEKGTSGAVYCGYATPIEIMNDPSESYGVVPTLCTVFFFMYNTYVGLLCMVF